jgi:predicted AAA+ superfamily ATPase
MNVEFIQFLRDFNDHLKRISDTIAPAINMRIFAEHRAFKVLSAGSRIVIRAIPEHDPVRFAELRGVDAIIKRLRGNVEQFLKGLPSNNILLYGPRGTGKSSAIKALLNEYGARGLRMIEMERDALTNLFEVGELIRGRPEKFIVFCDDLAFEAEEGSYRQLKAVLEGGLEARPANMLICATSNRRHLMPEQARDNQPIVRDGELHPSDTLEEKMSLSDRFGLRLGFYHFDADTYLEIVRNYIALRRMDVEAETLERTAMQWALEHGSYSGRTARQFIDDLEGRSKIR